MAKPSVQFTKDNEYYTPKKLVDYFGSFDYDPATTVAKAADLNMPNFDTIETDGLKADWGKYKRIWINPPFTQKTEFIKKAQQTYDLHRNEIYILFPIEFMTTRRFHNSVKAGTLYIPSGRINFESGLGKQGKSPAFGSVVLKLGDEWKIELIEERGR